MSIRDDELDFRKPFAGIDKPVRKFVPGSNGRDYSSKSYLSEPKTKLSILEGSKNSKNGYPLLISIDLDPADDAIPHLGNQPAYQLTTQFFNKTTHSIRVTNRQNVSFTIDKIQNKLFNEEDHFVIRKIHHFSNSDVARSVLHNFHQERSMFCIEDDERKQIIEQLEYKAKCGELRNYFASIEITIDRIIPIALFSHSPGIYINDLEILLTINGVNIETPHPCSRDAIIKGELIEQFDNKKVSGIFYEIVDNSNQYDFRYICLGKQVLQIPINKDPSRKPGIYSTFIDNTNIKNIEIRLQYEDISKAESLGIYTTKEMAETRGHVNETLKTEIIRLNLELEILQNKNKVLEEQRKEKLSTVQHEQKLLETETNIRATAVKHEAVIENHVLENVSARRKDYYEERSQVRKDSGEFLKWGPSVVSGLISIGALASLVALKKGKDKK